MASVTKLYHGNCVKLLEQLEDESIDAVITDPPYPYIKRDYGYWNEAEWWEMIVEGVIPQVRRVLKPSGSAVFILQPNSEKVGKIRPWLWRFMLWVTEHWNMVQDVWWWNISMIPEAHSIQGKLTRPSIKACVWCGSHNCYRNQESVLWGESERNAQRRVAARIGKESLLRDNKPSGHGFEIERTTQAAVRRGGVTPFNVLPIPNTDSATSAGAHGHGAGTHLKLADWWTRYICPPGGTILDPFCGAGTMGIAAVQNGCNFIGIEKEKQWVDVSEMRIREAQEKVRQLELI